MDLFTVGFPIAFSLSNLLYCFIGVVLGTLVGVLPGIGPLATISMLMPFTLYLDPTTALIMLAGVYYGTQYGGSTTAILLNLPGEASSAITALDGFPMAKQGRAGVALTMTGVCSFVGGAIGIILLVVLSPLLVRVALAFSPGDYFAMMLLGLIAAGSIGTGGPARGISMVMIGILVGCVGIDVNSGVARFDFGHYELFEGVGIVTLAMALFGATEIIASVETVKLTAFRGKVTYRSMIPSRQDIAQSVMPTLRGSGIGSFFGTLPGVGTTMATFFSYLVEKRVSRTPERFGKGAIEGVVAPEAANNAAAQTHFIPTLTLGIPGSATMAVMLGTMILHGIQPGPLLMVKHPDMFWGLIASFWIGNVMLVLLNVPLVGIWIKMLMIPYHLLYPVIIALICIGVYSINLNTFDVQMLVLIGVIGYVMRVLELEPAPLLLGFILGPQMEVYFRRAMLLSQGDLLDLFRHPLSGILLAISIGVILWSAFSGMKASFEQRIAKIEATADGPSTPA